MGWMGSSAVRERECVCEREGRRVENRRAGGGREAEKGEEGS